MIEDVPSCPIIHIQLVDLLLVLVDLALGLLNFLLHVLRFKLGRPSLLIHDVVGLLLAANLTVDVLQLATQPLRHLRLSTDHLL